MESIILSLKSKPISVPQNWGMFTESGNKYIHTKMIKLIDKLDNSKDYVDRVRELAKFIKSYRNMSQFTMGEASDTDVRERVYGFLRIISRIIGTTATLEEIWDNYI